MLLITALKEVISQAVTAGRLMCGHLHAQPLFLEPRLQEEPDHIFLMRKR